MAQDKDRKELLEEPDPVTVYLHRLFGILITYRKQLVMGGISLVAVILIASGVIYFLNRAENKAAAMLGKTMEHYDTVQAADGNFKDFESLKTEFKAIIDQYGYTNAADMAMIQYASVCYKSGDYKGAIEMYKKAADEFSGNFQFRNLIFNGLAYSYEASGDKENAVLYFEKIVEDKSAVMKDQALFNLGRLYGQLGKADKSRNAYEKIVSDYKDSLYFEPAKMKIAG